MGREPSDICTGCGASSQDVRHLFACTTHPTDLSPEDLWRNPVGSIRAFSYLDNGTLTDLKTDLVVENNNKAVDAETNPGPTTLNKRVWICDICYK